MASQWYVTRDQQKSGPFTSDQLKRLATDGKLLPTDQIWKEGMAAWSAASKVSGLFPTAPPPAVAAALSMPPPIPELIRDIRSAAAAESLNFFGQSNASATDFSTATSSTVAPPANFGGTGKRLDEQFCSSCSATIKLAAEICPKCGVRQKSSSGIMGFFRGIVASIKNRIDAAKKAIQQEQAVVTGISPVHKGVAIAVALSAGATGLTGLGSIIAGRQKAGFAMLGIPLLLGVLTISCFFATAFSAIASLFVIGIPFFFFFGTLLTVLVPLTVTTFIGFYVADVVICIKAK